MKRYSMIALASIASSAVALAKNSDTGSKAPELPIEPAAPIAPPIAPVAEGEVKVFAARKGLPIPEKKRSKRGGGKSPYGFENLEVGESIGIAGKTKKNFSSIIYGLNGKFAEPVKNEDGSTKTEVKVRTVGGVETRKVVDVTRQTRLFEAFDVDPSTDEDGASVRIFRMELPTT